MNDFELFDENYKLVLENIQKAVDKTGRTFEDITLLAATKTVSIEMVNHAFEKGLRYIGENKVQEFLSKYEMYNEKFHKQFIGTLQTNKVKQIVGKVEMIQSVDSVKLAKEISKHSLNQKIKTNVLIEINIGNEQAKSGINEEYLSDFLDEISDLKGIIVKGLMTLGPVYQNNLQKSKYFDKMYKLFIDNKSKNKDNISMDVLSMGMSDDYGLAIECGANMVRVGSALFGKRIYNRK